MSSSEYMTESEDANQFVDARVAPIDVDMENVASINQLGEAPVDNDNPAPRVNMDSPSPNN